MNIEYLNPTSIRRETDCQPRAKMDAKVIEGLVDVLAGDDKFQDPVTVFRAVDGTQRLADGFHRIAAHLAWCEKRGTIVAIRADVHEGDKQDAIVFAVKANSAHGMRRNSVDLRRAFEIAVRHDILDRGNARDVQAKLGCSLRTAERLTEPYRKATKKRRNDSIQKMAEDGHTQEQIAEEVGADQGTVSRNMHSRQVAETHKSQNDSPPGDSVSDAEPNPSGDLPGPFDKFGDSIRGFYKDIGSGIAVPKAAREVVLHSKACLEAVRNGDQVPDELVALLANFVRDSKKHVV